nr:unnamed protein product [Callosobruchus chinensis]
MTQDLPNFKRTTFYQFLKELDFRFLKRRRNSLMIEREEIVVWRREYLRKIKKFREEDRKIYYLDETWVNARHLRQEFESTFLSAPQGNGLSTGLKNPAEHRHKYNLNTVDEMAKKQNKTVLRLPPYHCELNPIDLIWANIKQYVASNNTTFKFCDAKKMFHVAVDRVSAEKWKDCIRYVKEKVETKMWDEDNLIDTQVESVIILILTTLILLVLLQAKPVDCFLKNFRLCCRKKL